MSPPVRLLALNWALDKPPAMIHRICSDRIIGRGENHQTLRADVSAAKSHEGVINTTEDLVPDEMDAVIDMDVEEKRWKGQGPYLHQGLPLQESSCVNGRPHS